MVKGVNKICSLIDACNAPITDFAKMVPSSKQNETKIASSMNICIGKSEVYKLSYSDKRSCDLSLTQVTGQCRQIAC